MIKQTPTLRFLTCVSALALATVALGAGPTMRYDPFPRSGSKVRIEGTSNIHDWQVESTLIGGFLEVGPGFPTDAGQMAVAGKVEARAEVFISVRSLASIEKDGRPYSTAMDDIMHDKLRMSDCPKILYRLTELALKEAPKAKDAPYVFDSKGELVVAGVTNQISMPVTVTLLGEQKLKIAGVVSIKMTDFKIEPPAPKIALGLIKTGDEVKLYFEWVIARKKSVAATGK